MSRSILVAGANLSLDRTNVVGALNPGHIHRARQTDVRGGGWPASSGPPPSPRSLSSSNGDTGPRFQAAPRQPIGPGAVQIAKLRLDGDADRLAAWLGAHRLPITVRPGPPAVASIVLTGAAGEIVLDADRL